MCQDHPPMRGILWVSAFFSSPGLRCDFVDFVDFANGCKKTSSDGKLTIAASRIKKMENPQNFTHESMPTGNLQRGQNQLLVTFELTLRARVTSSSKSAQTVSTRSSRYMLSGDKTAVSLLLHNVDICPQRVRESIRAPWLG